MRRAFGFFNVFFIVPWLGLSFLTTPTGIIFLIFFAIPYVTYTNIRDYVCTISDNDVPKYIKFVGVVEQFHEQAGNWGRTIRIRNISKWNSPTDLWVACYGGNGKPVIITADSYWDEIDHKVRKQYIAANSTKDLFFDGYGSNYSSVSYCFIGSSKEQALAQMGIKD